ncbi:MAG TPA: glycosyltransferase family 2 protein [Bacteroidetes bacterium]|nr:glycosyltransferase family 2 protein [Bacteroidota bacterium]
MMGQKPKISIIVVNYNGVDLLKECLESLLNQNFKSFEIILVDNGSSDGSVAYLKKYFKTVRIIELNQNLGFAKANNIGIEASLGEKIALINNDAVADRYWLKHLSQAIDNDTQCGFCASKILNYWDHSLLDAAGDQLGLARAYKRGHDENDGPKYSKYENVFGACACAALYRKSMLEDIGLFDEDFVSNLEDFDLSFRAQLKRYKCVYVPDARVYHKIGETKKKINWSGRLTYRNNKLFWLKNAPFPLLIRYCPKVFMDDIKLLYGSFRRAFSKEPQDSFRAFFTIVFANFEVLLMLPKTLKKRWAIQKNRIVTTEYILESIQIKKK